MEKLSLDEFVAQHGTATERRLELTERLREWLQIAASLGALRRVWVFGSFTSDKAGPGDLDVLALFSAGFDPAELPVGQREWFDHELCYTLHEIDLFYFTESTPESSRDLIIGTFSRDRLGREGMVEIDL